MKSNLNRRNEIFEGVLPALGTKEFAEFTEKFENNYNNNPELKEVIRKSKEKVTRSLEAQYLSSCDFITEKTLRFFLLEFNNRAWQYGLRSMPIMFNIMEAFFNYRKPEIYFELIEDENYLISYYDFIDFITSKNFNENIKLIDDNLSSDIIYNFNIGKDLYEIMFKTDTNDEFIVAGISIIRRNHEVTVLVITGKKEVEKLAIKKEELVAHTSNPNKVEMFNQFNESIKETDIEYEYIDEEKKYIKVVVACRIDLNTMTIDARYVAEETNLMFNIVTDEIDGFLNENAEFSTENHRELYQNNQASVMSRMN